MSYGKKDEDADLGLVKVDRTQVFQEGMWLEPNALLKAVMRQDPKLLTPPPLKGNLPPPDKPEATDSDVACARKQRDFLIVPPFNPENAVSS